MRSSASRSKHWVCQPVLTRKAALLHRASTVQASMGQVLALCRLSPACVAIGRPLFSSSPSAVPSVGPRLERDPWTGSVRASRAAEPLSPSYSRKRAADRVDRGGCLHRTGCRLESPGTRPPSACAFPAHSAVIRRWLGVRPDAHRVLPSNTSIFAPSSHFRGLVGVRVGEDCRLDSPATLQTRRWVTVTPSTR
jgi:hypothetical protein